MLQPVIKWSGSKRTQSKEILNCFDKNIDTYYEPFCGGASILGALLKEDFNIKNYVCSDLNEDLINLWNEIKENPKEVFMHYKNLWMELNKDDDLDRKKEFFNSIRKRLNENHNPLDFMFIMRTTLNGMPRYNSSGEFNNSFHITRNGINPDKLKDIIFEWSDLLNKKDVKFIHQSYENINPKEKDFVYLDPPYACTKGMYFGGIDLNKFFNFLRNIKCHYILSFDGKSGNEDNTYNVPIDIYKKHIYLKSGKSSFKRIIGKDKNSMVYESLYSNYDFDVENIFNM